MSNPEELWLQAQLKKEAAMVLEKELGVLENQGLTDLAKAKLKEVVALYDVAQLLMDEMFRLYWQHLLEQEFRLECARQHIIDRLSIEIRIKMDIGKSNFRQMATREIACAW
ncbi:g8722 [Coccomyxa viridis]|uniref:G8722 protein n=1 Tax=Coccomyxa viridis TaxID=1274662 RepID=A0ABP1G7T8_9CHLO